jgi:predicted RNA binding protein YcfA (HicA-like mRNA interferase family)
MPPKVREVIRMLEQDGWVQVRQSGSHRQFKHPAKPALITVPGNLGDELATGTYNSILRLASLKMRKGE